MTAVLEELDASISEGSPRKVSVTVITIKNKAVGLSEMSVIL